MGFFPMRNGAGTFLLGGWGVYFVPFFEDMSLTWCVAGFNTWLLRGVHIAFYKDAKHQGPIKLVSTKKSGQAEMGYQSKYDVIYISHCAGTLLNGID